MSLFPIFAKLQGRLVVVVGGGSIAAGKIPGLLQAQALRARGCAANQS